MCVTRTRGRADKVIASVVISRVWWDQALAQLPPSTSENITKPWNHKISIVERISQGIWSNLPPLTGLSFDRVCAWIPQAAGNSLLPRPASPDWGKSYLLLISLPHSCWLSSLKPGEWARFLSCVWQPFRIDICFCRITEFYSWRGTSDSWFCHRGEKGKGTCQGSLSELVEVSVLRLKFPDSWFRNLQWIMGRDALSGLCMLLTMRPQATFTF